MFLMQYLILEEEINRLESVANIAEFEEDLNTVRGQIQLDFNNIKEGFTDKEIPFGNELLITWFKRFNEALIYLKSNEVVSLKMPERNNIWLEFLKKESSLVVSKITSEEQLSIYDFVSITPVKRVGILWEETISKEEFLIEILEKTRNLLDDINSINDLLRDSQEFKELERIYMKAQQSL